MRIDYSLRPELHLDAAAADSGCGCEDHNAAAAKLGNTFDDTTINYVLKTQPHFEDLRNALGQLAGMLVLAAAGSKTVTQDHPLFATARQTFARVSDGIRSVRPTARAVHHHQHLIAALAAMGAALKRAQEDLHLSAMARERVDAVLVPLQSAHQQLRWATEALPGFEIVDLSQACCAPRNGATLH